MRVTGVTARFYKCFGHIGMLRVKTFERGFTHEQEKRPDRSWLLAMFAVWTVLIQTVDVQPIGALETEVGFAAMNDWFPRVIGIHRTLYTITDWQ